MRAGALVALVRRDLRRSVRTLLVAALGIAVGIATLAFFMALGAGMRGVVLGRIFPIDRIEIGPREALAGAVVEERGGDAPEGITPAMIARLRRAPGVSAVYPKLRLAFPTSGRGGRELIGRDIGTGELVADGIEPALVRGDLRPGVVFDEPPAGSRTACRANTECPQGEYCDVDLARDGAPQWPGACAPPIPGLISPYLIEVFEGAIAPAHGLHLPPIAELLFRDSDGVVLEWDLGRAGLGNATQGRPRRAHVRVVGVSARALDIGITVPLAVARRLNREFAGEGTDQIYTSAVVQLSHPSDTARVTAEVQAMRLSVRTSGAAQMGLLVAVITAILSLTSVIVVVVAALNIAHVFSTLIADRRGEIGLMRALGATRGDVRALVIAQAAVIGLLATLAGLVLARAAAFAWNRFAAARLPPFPFKPDDWFVFEPANAALIVLFGVAACVLSALAPAARAARIEPAAALAGGV